MTLIIGIRWPNMSYSRQERHTHADRPEGEPDWEMRPARWETKARRLSEIDHTALPSLITML